MLNESETSIDTVNSLATDISELQRNPPRAPELRESTYMENFDAETIFYDCYRVDNEIFLSGPPLFNLREPVIDSIRNIAGDSSIEVRDLDRTSHVIIRGLPATTNSLTLDLAGERFEMPIGRSRTAEFENRTVLITKSKNNELQWVTDWIKFYVKNHRVDGVIIYDNNSTAYSLEELAQAVSDGGAAYSTVVNWPFKFGPQGGKWNGPVERPWDSDFCEYGINEHARWKYLSKSNFIIAHDIDELLLVDQNTPIQDIAASRAGDYLSYSGSWVEDTPHPGSDLPRFSDFYYTDPHANPTTRKWSADTTRIADATQWKTHSIAGAASEKTPEVTHRHFRGISTNWKWQRSGRSPEFSSRYLIDRPLKKVLDSTYGERSNYALSLAGELETSESPVNAYFEDIIEGVYFQRWHSEGLKKLWFWKPEVFVADFATAHFGRIAFELRLSPERLTLTAMTREKGDSADRFRETFGAEFQPFGNSGKHYEINWWPTHLAANDIARSAALDLQSTFERFLRSPNCDVKSSNEPLEASQISKVLRRLRGK